MDMRNRRLTYLLIILVLPVIYGIKLIVDAKSQPIIVFTNLSDLFRKGYDLVDDNYTFSKVCILLNDSLLLQKESLKMSVFTDVNMSDSTIDWSLCYDEESEPLKVSDRYFFNIDLDKGGHIRIQETPAQLSDIRGLARDYIFYPDSASRKRVFTKRNIDRKREIEVSGAGVHLKVHIKSNNGFSVSDWQIFYKCLHELIELFEDERNKMSMQVWGKDYASLSFQEKDKIIDFTGYRINIEFE